MIKLTLVLDLEAFSARSDLVTTKISFLRGAWGRGEGTEVRFGFEDHLTIILFEFRS